MTKLVLALLLASSVARASEEEIHDWKQLTLVSPAGSFGDVEVAAMANGKGEVQTLSVKVGGKVLVVPPAWLKTLPALPLSTIEVRSEAGYDPAPWLYIVFRPNRSADEHVHVAFHGGKLDHASITKRDAKGGATSRTVAAP